MDPPNRRKALDRTLVSAVPGATDPDAGPSDGRRPGSKRVLAIAGLAALAAGYQLFPAPGRPSQVLVLWDGPRLTLRASPTSRLELDVITGAPGASRARPMELDDGWLTARLEPEAGAIRLVSRSPGILDLEIPRVEAPAFPDDLLGYALDLPSSPSGSWSCQFTADHQNSERVDGVTEGTKVRFSWIPPRSAHFLGIASLEGACSIPGTPPLVLTVQARMERELPTLAWLQEDLLEKLDPKTRGTDTAMVPESVKNLFTRIHGLPEGAGPAAWAELETLYRRRIADPASRDPSRLEWLQWTWLLEILARAHVIEPPIHVLDILTPHLTLQVKPLGPLPLQRDFHPVGMYFMESPNAALTDFSFQLAMGAFGKEPLEPDTPDRPSWVSELQHVEAWGSEHVLEPFTDGDVRQADPLGIRLLTWHFFRRQPYVLSFDTVGTARTRRLLIGNEFDRGHHGNPHQTPPLPDKPGSWMNMPATGSRVEVVVPRAYVGSELPQRINIRMLDLPDPRRDSKYASILGVEWFDPGAVQESSR